MSKPFSDTPRQLVKRLGLEPFELRFFGDLLALEPLWLELNQRYKGGELSLDWKAHRLIWEGFYARRSGRFWAVAALEGDIVQAIFPMVKEEEGAPWSLCDEFIIGREYFCPPELIHRFAALLASIHQEDMSTFYRPVCPQPFLSAPSGVINLKANPEDYLASLDGKVQKNLRRIRRINEDLRVELDERVRRDEIAGVLRSQLDYWLRKKGFVSEAEYSYSRDKIQTDLALMERAAEMGKLISLYIYQGARLLAANFSVKRGETGVDDYLCLRDCDEAQNRRSLGLYAILRNQEVCRGLGLVHYDLSACMAPYKQALINTEMEHLHLFRSPVPLTEGSDRSEQRS